MNKGLLRRLEKLEAHRPILEVGGLFWQTEIVDRHTLRPNERVVEDWYLDSQDDIQSTSERITTDPADQGWNYKETANGQIIVSNIQREIKVVNNVQYYRTLCISHADISIDSKDA